MFVLTSCGGAQESRWEPRHGPQMPGIPASSAGPAGLHWLSYGTVSSGTAGSPSAPDPPPPSPDRSDKGQNVFHLSKEKLFALHITPLFGNMAIKEVSLPKTSEDKLSIYPICIKNTAYLLVTFPKDATKVSQHLVKLLIIFLWKFTILRRWEWCCHPDLSSTVFKKYIQVQKQINRRLSRSPAWAQISLSGCCLAAGRSRMGKSTSARAASSAARTHRPRWTACLEECLHLHQRRATQRHTHHYDWMHRGGGEQCNNDYIYSDTALPNHRMRSV